MLRGLLCRVFGHRVHRMRVWHDGQDMRGRCRICSVPMIRGRYAWREFDTERDANTRRAPHPRAS